MSQEKFVTGNLHRISGKLAEVAKKHEQELAQRKTGASPGPSSGENAPGSSLIPAEKEKETPSSAAPASPVPGEAAPSREGEKPSPEDLELLAVSARGTVTSGEKRKRLSDATEAALQRHHEEGLRLRRDLQMLLESIDAGVMENRRALERDLAALKELSLALDEARKEFSLLSFPDPDSPEYQMLLASLYRKMDKVKIDLLHLKAKAERIGPSGRGDGESGTTAANINLFAEMHSLRKGMLFRTGFWMMLPLILGILLAALLLAASQILTFRVGL